MLGVDRAEAAGANSTLAVEGDVEHQDVVGGRMGPRLGVLEFGVVDVTHLDTLRRAQGLRVAEGTIGHYVHGSVADGLGRIGVIVALESKGDRTQLSALGRQVAMHIAAASPVALDASGVDPATVQRERTVLAEKNAGKPANVIEKIVESGLKTFYKEFCLLDQAYVHDPAKSVAQAIKEAEKTVGGPIAITGFVRYALGEGVDKTAEEA